MLRFSYKEDQQETESRKLGSKLPGKLSAKTGSDAGLYSDQPEHEAPDSDRFQHEKRKTIRDGRTVGLGAYGSVSELGRTLLVMPDPSSQTTCCRDVATGLKWFTTALLVIQQEELWAGVSSRFEQHLQHGLVIVMKVLSVHQRELDLGTR